MATAVRPISATEADALFARLGRGRFFTRDTSRLGEPLHLAASDTDSPDAGVATLIPLPTGLHIANLAVGSNTAPPIASPLLRVAARHALIAGLPRLTACVHDGEPAIELLRGFGLRDLDPAYISAALLMPRDSEPDSPWRPLAAMLRSPTGHPLTESIHGVRAKHGTPLDGFGCGVGYAQIVVDFEVGDDPAAGFRFADRTGESDPYKAEALAAAGEGAVQALEEHYEGLPGDVLVVIREYRWHEVDSTAIAFRKAGRRAVEQALTAASGVGA